jgi:para-nitrobenzyl esterase
VLAAARARSPEEVLKVAQPSLRIGGVGGGNSFAPVIDGWSVPDAPARLFAEGAVNAVPFLCGTNSDEGAMFALQAPVSTHDRFVQTARLLYGGLVDEVLALYTTERYGDLRGVYSAILADSTFVAPTRAQVRELTAAGAPCFVYHFTRVAAGAPASQAGAGRAPGGAWHAAEVGYVFGNLADGPFGRYDARDRELSTTMMDCWVQFARTGDPNREGLPKWPKYSREEDRHLLLGDEISIGSGLRAAECDLWEKVAAAAAAGSGE